MAVLTGGAAFAQSKCQSNCTASNNCSTCTDDRCLRRCGSRLQDCMQACDKAEPSTAPKNLKLSGSCPGPGGRKMPCDQIPQRGPSEQEIKNMMAHPNVKKPNKEKDEANVPRQMPTADNYQQLYNEHQKQMKH